MRLLNSIRSIQAIPLKISLSSSNNISLLITIHTTKSKKANRRITRKFKSTQLRRTKIMRSSPPTLESNQIKKTTTIAQRNRICSQTRRRRKSRESPSKKRKLERYTTQ
jgi:hypothetical protein